MRKDAPDFAFELSQFRTKLGAEKDDSASEFLNTISAWKEFQKQNLLFWKAQKLPRGKSFEEGMNTKSFNE